MTIPITGFNPSAHYNYYVKMKNGSLVKRMEEMVDWKTLFSSMFALRWAAGVQSGWRSLMART